MIIIVGGIIFGYLLIGNWNREMLLLIRMIRDSMEVNIGWFIKKWGNFIIWVLEFYVSCLLDFWCVFFKCESYVGGCF